MIEARQLVGEWKDLRKDILARAQAKQKRLALEESITSRLNAAGFKKIGWGENVRVTVRNADRPEIEFQGQGIETLLKKLGV